MGSSTQTTKEQQHTESSPWASAIPGLQSVLDSAKGLNASGVGSQVYGGQRVAQFGDDTLNGLQSIRDQFASDNAAPQAISFAQGLLGSGGISATTRQGLGMLADVPNVDTSKLSALADRIGSADNPINGVASSFMSGGRDINTEGDLRGLLSRALAPSSAETNLSGVARGDFLDPTANPLFKKLADVSADNALTAAKGTFAASGRYGSGAFQGAATKAVNDTQSALYANQYNQERANQVSANSQIDSARQAGTQLGSGILGQIGNVQSTNNAQRLAGAGLAQGQQAAQASVLGQVLGGDEFNSSLGVTKANGFINAGQTGQAQALQAAGMLPALDAARYSPAQMLLGAGSIVQGQDQANLDGARDYFDDTQDVPWSGLGRYAGIVGGIGGLGGTTDSVGQKKTTQQQSIGSTLLGSLTSGLGLVGMFGSPNVGNGFSKIGGLFK